MTRAHHNEAGGPCSQARREQQPLTRQGALHCQSHRQDCHEGLVGHRVNDCAHNSPLVPFARYPAIEEISDACISEQAQCPGVLVVKDAVADERSRDEPRCSQDVGDGVDVLMSRDRKCFLQRVGYLGGLGGWF